MSYTEPQVTESAALVIWGGDFDPEKVTQLLGWQPSQAWRKGERKSHVRDDGSLRIFDSYYEWSGWKLWLDEGWSKRPLAEQMGHWAEQLSGKSDLLLDLRAEDANVELNCCIITSSSVVLHLPMQLQVQLGQLGVNLDITFYAHKAGKDAV